jgi:anti-sigma factor RsiW
MGIQLLTLDGGLDGSTAPAAGTSVEAAIGREPRLVFDLGHLRAIDANGSAFVRSALRRLLDAGFALAVVRPRTLDPARAIGGLCGRAGVPVVGTVSEAIEAVSPEWQPGTPRWRPERSVPITPRDKPPRRR